MVCTLRWMRAMDISCTFGGHTGSHDLWPSALAHVLSEHLSLCTPSMTLCTRRWDYRATKLVWGTNAFLGGNEAQPWPRLILFHPATPIRANSRPEVKQLVKDTLFLLQAMDSVSRIIVWPPMDCSSPWIRRNERAVHGVQDHRVFATGHAEDCQCFDIGYMNAVCSKLGTP